MLGERGRFRDCSGVALSRGACARGCALQSRAEGGDRLLQPPGAGLAFAEGLKRIPEIVLGHRPVEGPARAGALLQGRAEGGDLKDPAENCLCPNYETEVGVSPAATELKPVRGF